jgi:hypothetical protein
MLCSVELCIHIACLQADATKREKYGEEMLQVKFPRFGKFRSVDITRLLVWHWPFEAWKTTRN